MRFAFRLALALGGMTVEEMLDRMGGAEFLAWITFYRLEPFGEIRADARAGIIAATVANTTRQKGQNTAVPSDFIPDFEQSQPKKRGQSVQEMMQTFKRHTTATK